MILNTRAIFTTDEFIKDLFIKKFDFKKITLDKFEVYNFKREKNDEIENIVFIYFKKEYSKEAINYVNENYIVFKFVIIWYSKIVRNQDLDSWDIIFPNTYLDNTWNNPFFLEYLVWENYDLNKFWLILNGIWMEKNCDCNNCDNDDLEEKNDEFTADVVDCSTYKILSNLEKKDIEKTVVIWICIKNQEDKYNPDFVENLLNIVDVMI